MRLSVYNKLTLPVITALLFLTGCGNEMTDMEQLYHNDAVSINALMEHTRAAGETVDSFSEGDRMTVISGDLSSEYHLSAGKWISEKPLKWSQLDKDAGNYYNFIARHDPSSQKNSYDNSGYQTPDMLSGKSRCYRNEEPVFVLNHITSKVTFNITLDEGLYWGNNTYVQLDNIFLEGQWDEDSYNATGETSDLRVYASVTGERKLTAHAIVVSQKLQSIKIGIRNNDTREYYYTFASALDLKPGTNTVVSMKLIKGDLSIALDKITITGWKNGQDVSLGDVADSDFIYIKNEDELLRLKYMAELTGSTFVGKTLILNNDITLTSGNSAYFGVKVPFRGTFDGNGKTIYGYNADSDENSNIGFFACTDGATIKNLSISGNIISRSNLNYVGGIVAEALNNTVISQCSFSGKIQSCSYTGAIAGRSQARILNCTSTANVNVDASNKFIGGIAAINHGFIIACNSKSVINITGKECYVGGMAGENKNFIVSCKNEETITNASTGTLLSGVFIGSNSGRIYGCWSSKSGSAPVGSEQSGSVNEGTYAKASISSSEVSDMNNKISLYKSLASFNNYPDAPYWTYSDGSANIN